VKFDEFGFGSLEQEKVCHFAVQECLTGHCEVFSNIRDMNSSLVLEHHHPPPPPPPPPVMLY